MKENLSQIASFIPKPPSNILELSQFDKNISKLESGIKKLFNLGFEGVENGHIEGQIDGVPAMILKNIKSDYIYSLSVGESISYCFTKEGFGMDLNKNNKQLDALNLSLAAQAIVQILSQTTETNINDEIALMKETESKRTKDLMEKFFGSNDIDLQYFEFQNVKYSLQKDNRNFVLKFKDKHITFSENGEGQEFFESNNMNQKGNVIRELKIYEHKVINDTLTNYLASK